MGSKTTPNRSEKDSVIIREPLSVVITGGKSRQDQIAETCELSFHVKLKESTLVIKDLPVDLKKSGSRYNVVVLASIVGTLTTKQSEMINKCARLGVTYAGKVIKEKTGMYARFKRLVR